MNGWRLFLNSMQTTIEAVAGSRQPPRGGGGYPLAISHLLPYPLRGGVARGGADSETQLRLTCPLP